MRKTEADPLSLLPTAVAPAVPAAAAVTAMITAAIHSSSQS
jgi:hypothetical protein